MAWFGSSQRDANGARGATAPWLAVLTAALLGLLLGAGAAIAIPGGGEALVRRALPAPTGTALPRIVNSARTEETAPLVVLDPGHGGFDPGASSLEGAREKDIVLALALAVRDRLVALGGVRVALTREEDRYVPLEGRPALAEALGADIFVSIHADSAPSDEASGANAYVLSTRASDREAQALARVENERAAGGAAGPAADDVALVLADLMRRETALGSARLARALAQEAQGAMPVHAPFRRSANFVVLRSPEMPSVLFEAGYLTNAEDAARLADPAERAKLAEALADAIVTALLAPETL